MEASFLHRKGLVIGILILMIAINMGSTFAGEVDVTMLPVGFDRNTLYVGGSGSGNYTNIQDAIDDAENGDTIYVYNGTYSEGIIIDKTINLIGEERDTTIIDSTNINDVTVFIMYGANGVTVSGFTIKNDEIDTYAVSINMFSDYNIIENNIIKNREGILMEKQEGLVSAGNIISNNNISTWIHGIDLDYSDNNIIRENIITDCGDGAISLSNSVNNTIIDNILIDNNQGIFLLSSSNYNNISDNFISNDDDGIGCSRSDYNIFSGNTITKHNDFGLLFDFCIYNSIYGNNITQNYFGIGLFYSPINNKIYENNFIDNIRDASWQHTILDHIIYFLVRNRWDGNYWGRERITPKPIFGFLYCGSIGMLPLLLPSFQFDLHPSQELYDI